MLSGELPAMIHLYRRPLLDEWAETGVSLEELVTHVIVHEVGHHFGFSDADMHAIEEWPAGVEPAGASTTVACVRGGRLLFEGLDLSLAPGDAALGHRAERRRQIQPDPARGGLAARRRPEASSAAARRRWPTRRWRSTKAAASASALGLLGRLDGATGGAGMAAMGLAHLAEVPVRMLSTGQRKRASAGAGGSLAARRSGCSTSRPTASTRDGAGPARGRDRRPSRRRRRHARRLASAARPRRRADGGAGMSALLLRELRLAATGGSALLPLIFFLLVATLFPFAVGPDAPLLARTGGGALWMAALLAALLPVDRLVEPDRRRRRARSARAARRQRGEHVALAKLAGHWLSFGPPLMLAALPAAALLELPARGAGPRSSSACSPARPALPP